MDSIVVTTIDRAVSIGVRPKTCSIIREEGTKIHTISIPNQGLISVNSTDEGATFAGVVMNTGTNANNGNKNGDTIQDLTTTSQEETKKYMYGFLNTANYASLFCFSAVALYALPSIITWSIFSCWPLKIT